jgi:hypothetical protein
MTLLALWTGKVEFGDPRKITEWQVISRSWGYVALSLRLLRCFLCAFCVGYFELGGSTRNGVRTQTQKRP